MRNNSWTAPKETTFWARFRDRLAGAMDTEIPQTANILVKPKHRMVMQPLLEDQARVITREIEDGTLRPSAILSRSVKRPTTEFPPVSDLRWGEVSFDFFSDDSVKIVARGTSKVFRFSDMGFADGRKDDRPDCQWELLREIARHHGELKWSDKAPARVKDGAKIKAIRKLLKAVMHIDDDPFEPYPKVKAYKPRFEITDSYYSRQGPDGNHHIED